MKVLVLPRYNRLGASSRLRIFQYSHYLEDAGISLTFLPLFSDQYVLRLQKGKRNIFDISSAYFTRAFYLLQKKEYDLLWIEKELLPWLPVWVERVLLSSHIPYVLDYDDAVFHYYDMHQNYFIRKLLGGKHRALLGNATLVIAGNDYLAAYAEEAGAGRVTVLPTVVDLERYTTEVCKNIQHRSNSPCVGWIGQYASSQFLLPYKFLFEKFTLEGKANFMAVGIDALSLGLRMRSEPWSEDTEVSLLQNFDIGIMPLTDGPFERGKCGYKLIQYMACGLPVVASPIGINRELVTHGINGFLADTYQEWEEALSTLLSDEGLRKQMGREGRRIVEDKYNLQKIAPQLAALLKSAIG